VSRAKNARANGPLGPPEPSGEHAPTSHLSQSGPSSQDRRATSVALAIAAAAVVIRIAVMRATHCTIEDAYITLRYAENLAHGHGFVYNFGERVLGTTTPLFTLILACFTWLGLDALTLGKALCILADGAVCYLLARTLASLGHVKAGWLAAILYSTMTVPIKYSIGGMETALVTLAGMAAVYAYVRRRSWSMCVWLALLFLLRIDGLLLAAALLGGWWLRERTVPWRHLALAGLIVLPWVLFATAYFGSPIPQSLIAKVVVYNKMHTQPLRNLPILRGHYAGDAVHAGLFLIAVAGGLYAWRAHPRLRAPLAWWLLYHAGILASKAPVEAFGWYFVPPMPLYCLATALGFAWIGSQIAVSLSPRRLAAVQHAFLVLAVAGLLWNLRSITSDIAANQQVEDTLRKPIGLWLARNTRPEARVMVEAIGYVGYFSRRPILDMVGLVSPEVLASHRSGTPYPVGDIVARFRPEFLVLRQSETEEIEAYSRATGRPLIGTEYLFVRRFPDERSDPAMYLHRRKDVVLPDEP
jgi:hypothetical protein